MITIRHIHATSAAVIRDAEERKMFMGADCVEQAERYALEYYRCKSPDRHSFLFLVNDGCAVCQVMAADWTDGGLPLEKQVFILNDEQGGQTAFFGHELDNLCEEWKKYKRGRAK